MGLKEICEECGGEISRRAKANIWRSKHVVCTTCFRKLQAWEAFQENRERFQGSDGALWSVNDGGKLRGPFETEILERLLQDGGVSWDATVWRHGMKEWKAVAGLFSIPALNDNKPVRLTRAFDKPNPPRLL